MFMRIPRQARYSKLQFMTRRNENIITPPAEEKMGTRCSFVKEVNEWPAYSYLKMLFTSPLKVKGYAIIQ